MSLDNGQDYFDDAIEAAQQAGKRGAFSKAQQKLDEAKS